MTSKDQPDDPTAEEIAAFCAEQAERRRIESEQNERAAAGDDWDDDWEEQA